MIGRGVPLCCFLVVDGVHSLPFRGTRDPNCSIGCLRLLTRGNCRVPTAPPASRNSVWGHVLHPMSSFPSPGSCLGCCPGCVIPTPSLGCPWSPWIPGIPPSPPLPSLPGFLVGPGCALGALLRPWVQPSTVLEVQLSQGTGGFRLVPRCPAGELVWSLRQRSVLQSPMPALDRPLKVCSG